MMFALAPVLAVVEGITELIAQRLEDVVSLVRQIAVDALGKVAAAMLMYLLLFLLATNVSLPQVAHGSRRDTSHCVGQECKRISEYEIIFRTLIGKKEFVNVCSTSCMIQMTYM